MTSGSTSSIGRKARVEGGSGRNLGRLRAHRAAGSGIASRTRLEQRQDISHLRTPARRAAIGTITAAKRMCWVFIAITACHPTGKRTTAGEDRRASGRPGGSATPVRLPRVICPRRGHPRGHIRTKQGQPPLVSYLVSYTSRAIVLETRWPRCISVACWRIHSPRFGRRVRPGATPLRSNDLRPRNPALVTPVVSCSGSLPARA